MLALVILDPFLLWPSRLSFGLLSPSSFFLFSGKSVWGADLITRLRITSFADSVRNLESNSCQLKRMDPRHTEEILRHLEKGNELFMDAHGSMSPELHKLQVEEEMLMRKLYVTLVSSKCDFQKECRR